MKRKIIEIDESKCNGCGLCIPNCPEGALQIVENKARLVNDFYCDGLGACVGHCPQGAISVIEREAKNYDEKKAMEQIVKHGQKTIKAHLNHLKEHGEKECLKQAFEYLEENGIDSPLGVKDEKSFTPCACPGSETRVFNQKVSNMGRKAQAEDWQGLNQWPIQLSLLPTRAPFFQQARLLIISDCVAFADPVEYAKLAEGRTIVIGCPKLDNVEEYIEKLTDIFSNNELTDVTVAIMEVPCCGGMYAAVMEALHCSGKEIPVKKKIIPINKNSA